MIGGIINEEALLANLRGALSKEMQAAAEPLVKSAMADIEKAMRLRLAEMLVSMVRGEVDLYRDGRDLTIRVREPKS